MSTLIIDLIALVASKVLLPLAGKLIDKAIDTKGVGISDDCYDRIVDKMKKSSHNER